MQKRISRLPFLGFLLLFVVPIAAVFLLAHDARNLKQVMRWAGLPIEDLAVAPADARSTALPVKPRQQRPATPGPRPGVPLDQRLLADPAPQDERSAGLFDNDPQRRCRSIAQLGRADPDFASVAGDWTCLVEFHYPNSEDVLFLQVRGRGASQGHFRAKLNLLDARGLEPMLTQMAKALQISEPVDPVYVARLVRRAVDQGQDAEMALGFGRIRIERERGEERRYNIFIQRDTPRRAPPTPDSGFRLTQSLRRPAE